LIYTGYGSCTLQVKIQAKKACVVYLNVYDSKVENTFEQKRFRAFHSDEVTTLYVQMPLSGEWTIAEFFEDAQLGSGNFQVLSITKTGLPKFNSIVATFNDKVKKFIPFAQRFCFNASVLTAYDDRDYVSKNGDFKIKYSTIIQDNGKEQLTPARINKVTQVIEVSKAKFLSFTVPMRFCILCHEFSHLFLNEDMYNELEADLNGLIIYLGLGYPRFEAHETFISTFDGAGDAAAALFQQRYQYIQDFINRFDQLSYESFSGINDIFKQLKTGS
jgi:hypothetical protein